ncbi:MAG: hypothetical protein Q9213_004359 [Squamulea squamosa]
MVSITKKQWTDDEKTKLLLEMIAANQATQWDRVNRPERGHSLSSCKQMYGMLKEEFKNQPVDAAAKPSLSTSIPSQTGADMSAVSSTKRPKDKARGWQEGQRRIEWV